MDGGTMKENIAPLKIWSVIKTLCALNLYLACGILSQTNLNNLFQHGKYFILVSYKNRKSIQTNAYVVDRYTYVGTICMYYIPRTCTQTNAII